MNASVGYLFDVDQPLAPPTMDRVVTRRRLAARWRWLLALLAATVVAGIVALILPPSGAVVVDAAAVDTGLVVRAPFKDTLPLRAEVAPLHSVVLSAVTGGTVATLVASDGTLVAKGAPLAQLDNPTLQLEVTAREVEIASRLTDLSAQELALRRTAAEVEGTAATAANESLKAEHDLAQHQYLFDRGIIAPTALAPYQRDAAFRRDRLAALHASDRGEHAAAATQSARLGEARAMLLADLTAVRGELTALTVRSPVAGRLTGFVLQPGQAIKAGDPLGQIDSEGASKLIGEVDEFYLSRLAVGQQAVATIDGRDVRLTVDRVRPQVVGGRFKVELVFGGPTPADLRRGQTVDARVTLGDAKLAVVAPNGPWLDAGGTTAFVIDGNRATRRVVTTGRRTPEQVEITGGLHPGERIVTSGLAAYRTATSLLLREGNHE